MYFGSIGAAATASTGVRSFYVGPISEDYFGNLMMEDFKEKNVGLDYIRRTSFISMVAVVSEDGKGGNKYAFYGRNQMNTTEHLQMEELPKSFSQQDRLFCFGSVATTLSPSGQTLKKFANTQKETGSIILYDPNTRPSVITDREAYRVALENWVRIASIVKASEEDILFTYPDEVLEDVAQKWLDLGALAVFITLGEKGCSVYTNKGSEHFSGISGGHAAITSTVGAGDNFNAGILVGLAKEQRCTNEALSKMELSDWIGLAEYANQLAFNHLQRVNQSADV